MKAIIAAVVFSFSVNAFAANSGSAAQGGATNSKQYQASTIVMSASGIVRDSNGDAVK